MYRRNTRIIPITEISHEPTAPTFEFIENKQKSNLLNHLVYL